MASPRFPGDARLRHDGGDPPSHQSATAQKNEPPNSEKKPKRHHTATDPLVDPRNPPHRRQARSKAYSTRAYHRMVILAKGSPSCRSTRSPQSKNATVMLGDFTPSAVIRPAGLTPL